jgi:hypothetical protein
MHLGRRASDGAGGGRRSSNKAQCVRYPLDGFVERTRETSELQNCPRRDLGECCNKITGDSDKNTEDQRASVGDRVPPT